VLTRAIQCRVRRFHSQVICNTINVVPVFETAAGEDTVTALSLSLVCDTSYAWTISVLYKTVTLGTPKKIKAFHAAICKPGSSSDETKYNVALRVRHLWIGSTDTPVPDGEDHGSQEVGLMVQILQTCTGLRALALFAVPGAAWNRLSNALPPRIESLTYDYVADLLPRAFISSPAVRRVTTVFTCRRDSDLRSIVKNPRIRCFTQFFPGMNGETRAALEQLPIIAQSLSSTIEHVRIVVCRDEVGVALDDGDRSDGFPADIREEFAEFLTDKRIGVVARRTTGLNWKKALYEDWKRDECASSSDGRESTS
jgi:hypothetical protein